MSAWFDASELDINEFAQLIATRTNRAEYPLAADLQHEVLIYDAQPHSMELEAEWNQALGAGPGVIVIRGAFADTAVIDAATSAYEAMIDAERSASEHGDHFGAPGANARVWNSLEKLAIAAPEVFVQYFANDTIATASRAWLGPNYQLSAQVNLVYPEGAAQQPHRDYHLGFQSDAQAIAYPKHTHLLSPMLTLQGAVAHCDMPVESGPTMLLPHSQKYPAGYLAYRNAAFIELFEQRQVQLPLQKGDVLFFNPAVFHGAGANRSSGINRMANLLQVSSAFGRTMEVIDREKITLAIYDALASAMREPQWTAQDTANVIAASAEGYPFPTNLDLDQPMYGLAPLSQAELVREALDRGHGTSELSDALTKWRARRTT